MAHTPVVDQPEVTVVVVVHNDPERLPRAVRSAVAQTLERLEVVIVDDASTDGTQQVAERLAADDPHRVRYLRLAANTGAAGGPRNVGIDSARGRFVMFLDSDDELDHDACRLLLAAAQDSGADITAGRCVRVEVGAGGRIDPWFDWLYRERASYASIDERPDLLFDTNSTNKLYPLEFLHRTGLRFPEGRFYEDLEFITKAYVLARGITVIPDRVYLWYIYRDLAARLSVTQSRRDLKNAMDRLAVHRDLDVFLAEHASPEVRTHKDVKFLKIDLKLYVQDIPEHTDADAHRIMDELAAYLEGIEPAAYERIDPVLRAAAFLVRCRDLAGVATVADYLLRGRRLSVRLHVDDDRAYWGCAHLDTAAGRAALDVTDLGLHRRSFRRLELHNEVAMVDVGPRSIHLEGVLLNQLDRIPADGEVDLQIVVRPEGAGRPLAVPAQFSRGAHGDLVWSADVDLAPLGRSLGLVVHRWTVQSVLRAGHGRTTSRLTVRDRGASGCRLDVRPRAGAFAAAGLETLVTPEGDLVLQYVDLGRGARWVTSGRAALRPVRTFVRRARAGLVRRIRGRRR